MTWTGSYSISFLASWYIIVVLKQMIHADIRGTTWTNSLVGQRSHEIIDHIVHNFPVTDAQPKFELTLPFILRLSINVAECRQPINIYLLFLVDSTPHALAFEGQHVLNLITKLTRQTMPKEPKQCYFF